MIACFVYIDYVNVPLIQTPQLVHPSASMLSSCIPAPSTSMPSFHVHITFIHPAPIPHPSPLLASLLRFWHPSFFILPRSCCPLAFVSPFYISASFPRPYPSSVCVTFRVLVSFPRPCHPLAFISSFRVLAPFLRLCLFFASLRCFCTCCTLASLSRFCIPNVHVCPYSISVFVVYESFHILTMYSYLLSVHPFTSLQHERPSMSLLPCAPLTFLPKAWMGLVALESTKMPFFCSLSVIQVMT